MFNLFDINKKAFINISSDNRIHLFDLDSGKEKQCFVERDHLSHQYTSVSWSRSITNTGGCGDGDSFNNKIISSNKNDSVVNSKNGSLAIGTSDSKVIIFDLDRGVVKGSFDIDGGVPIDVCYSSSSGSSIYVATSGSSYIQRISCSDGSVISTIKAGKRGILRMCSHPKVDNIVACGNTSIRICSDDSNSSSSSSSIDNKYNKDKKETILMKINTSFPRGLTILEYSSCGRYMACCGMGSKELLIYSTEEGVDGGEGGDDADGIPVAVVALDHVPKSIPSFQTSISTKSKNQRVTLLFIFVIMENETACVVKANSAANSISKFDSNVIKLAGSKVQVLAGSLGTTSNPKSLTSITVALGNYKKPYFQELAIASEGAYLSSLIIPVQSSSSTNSSSSSSSSSHPSTNVHNSVQVLGPLDTGLAKRPHVNIDNNNSNISFNSNSLNSAESGSDSSKKMKFNDNSSRVSVTNNFNVYSQILENRFDAFSSQLTSLSKASSRSVENGKHESDSSNISITPQNLCSSIDKALQAGDNNLLDECLFFSSVEDSASRLIIEETCRKLPSEKVVQFLKKIIAKFECRPTIGGVAYWLGSLLKSHGDFLAASVPDLSRHFGSLTSVIEQRMTTQSRFTSLAGRMDILLAQSTQGGSE